jgi:SOS-response transcriptional repressor LexA
VPDPALGERIREIRHAKRPKMSMRELGEKLGHTGRSAEQVVWTWETGRVQVPSGDLPAIAAALGVSVADLYADSSARARGPSGSTSRSSGSGARNPQAGDSSRASDFFNVTPLEQRDAGVRRLPIYRWGSLGDPRDRESPPDPDRLDYPPLGRESLIGPNGFGVEVRGESMVARGLHDGYVVWVNPDRPYRLGGVVLAMVDDGEDSGMVVKTFGHTEVGDCLLSETESGKSTVVCREFRIIGPVVWIQPAGFPPR